MQRRLLGAASGEAVVHLSAGKVAPETNVTDGHLVDGVLCLVPDLDNGTREDHRLRSLDYPASVAELYPGTQVITVLKSQLAASCFHASQYTMDALGNPVLSDDLYGLLRVALGSYLGTA